MFIRRDRKGTFKAARVSVKADVAAVCVVALDGDSPQLAGYAPTPHAHPATLCP